MYRREIIPYLLLNKEFASLSFQIIDKFKFPEEQQSELSRKLWIDCLSLALITIRSEISNDNVASKLVFQIYRQLNSNKYHIPYNRLSKKDEDLIIYEKEKREKLILSLIENCHLNNYVNNYKNEYLIPHIYNELLKLFDEFKFNSLYNNGCVQFPLIQFDGLIWLMKCSTYWKYKEQLRIITPNNQLLTNTFFKLYIGQIEMEEVDKYNYFEKRKEKGLPLWSEKIERLESLEWIYPIYFLFKQQKLNSFLEPRFSFDATEDYYHKKNHFTADKLRTHIGVLLQVLRKLISPSIPYGFDKKELQVIKIRIEQQIIDYLSNHVKDIPLDGKIDLFNYNKESSYNSSEKEALFPQIARTINWFEKKEEIIDSIISSNDIIKILTLTEWITSESIRKKLIEKIKQSDLQLFLESSHWIPQIQSTLLKITHYPELMNQIEVIVNFWEDKISKKGDKHLIQLYQTKLLISYFHNNEVELNSIKLPENKTAISNKELSLTDHKEFYRALMKIHSNALSAHAIFNDLLKRYPQFPVLAMNRMAAKINLANKEDESELYREALEEWNEYEKENTNIDINSLGATFYANKLLILYKLGETIELDDTYRNIEFPYQMLPNIIEVKIESLLSQKRVEEAMLILDTAEKYHQFSGKEEIEFVKDLRAKLNGIDNIDELRVHYNRIFNSVPEKLIKIFPEKLNGRIDLYEFITTEVAFAANKMLDKVNSISDIKGENKYNDLVQLALESRVSTWGWTVKDQTRKAFSPSAIDLGEIDLDIQDCNNNSFVTCEAFILRDIPRVQSHLEKVIADYTHNRKFFIILVYYTDNQINYNNKWIEYTNSIVPNLTFPFGYEMKSTTIEDVTKQFGYQNSAIKIGKSMHGNESTLFHIFININYKIQAIKKVRKRKSTPI